MISRAMKMVMSSVPVAMMSIPAVPSRMRE